ncbi:hypothetical protein H2200_004659 [Cladophialophora chaetospira]|uniref:MARVEL domain-containing protein n=1 Tax=Cladophialophora chaetospira TaxID=386627 RepID=A0AA38XDN4_9EURO|nr:hypothetical protein H2200_004659 [Cladophialophora chaetospira]
MFYSDHLRKVNFYHIAARFCQIIVGSVIIGLYAHDLRKALKAHKYADGKWVSTTDPKTGAATSLPPEIVRLLTGSKVFAVSIGSISTLTALVFMVSAAALQYRLVVLLTLWEWLMTIMLATLSGIFGNMYLSEKVEMEGGIQRMKTAVIFDIMATGMWFMTALVGTWWYMSENRKRPRVEIPNEAWQGEAGLQKPKGSLASRTLRR